MGKPVRRPSYRPAPELSPRAEDDAPLMPLPQAEPWTGTFVPPRLAPGEMDALLERMRLFGLDGGPGFSDLPAQDDLDALTPEELWVRLKGETPLEFLVRIYRNPWIPMAQRLGAASKVMDYVHKQKARTLEGANGQALIPGALQIGGLGPVDVGKLNDDELSSLDALLSKARLHTLAPPLPRADPPPGPAPSAPAAPPPKPKRLQVGKPRSDGPVAAPSAGTPAPTARRKVRK